MDYEVLDETTLPALPPPDAEWRHPPHPAPARAERLPGGGRNVGREGRGVPRPAFSATGSDAPSATAALVPWICDVLLSNHSVKAYGRDLMDFVRHMQAQGVDPLKVTADHVKCYKRRSSRPA